VIHTVGPVARGHVGKSQRELLTDCYQNSLKLIKEHGLRSVAFPCISTGIYGFPNEPAAEIALKTVKSWIKKNSNEVDRVIFCVFLETDYKIYKEKMSRFFSQDNDVNDEGTEGQTEEGKKETSTSKKTKSKKQSKGEEDHEEDDENKEDSKDINMESQPEEDDKPDNLDVEMESQNLDNDGPELEETKEKKEVKDKEPSPDLSRKEESPVTGDRQSEEVESAEDSAENKSDSSKDGAKTQLTQVVTAGAAKCLDKDPADRDISAEEAGSGEPMESEDVAGGDFIPKNKVYEKEAESSAGEVEMKTQSADSQEPELSQEDSNQSKDGAGNLEDP
ncbi:hypothetical protein MATL_G00189260, partial [Megalops atlanticus]